MAKIQVGTSGKLHLTATPDGFTSFLDPWLNVATVCWQEWTSGYSNLHSGHSPNKPPHRNSWCWCLPVTGSRQLFSAHRDSELWQHLWSEQIFAVHSMFSVRLDQFKRLLLSPDFHYPNIQYCLDRTPLSFFWSIFTIPFPHSILDRLPAVV
jgi:hypothetical protein